MIEWQPVETAPRDGTRCLWWVDFEDDLPLIGMVYGYWEEDPRGFCLKPVTCSEDGGWHKRGVKLWHPAPPPPKLGLWMHE